MAYKLQVPLTRDHATMIVWSRRSIGLRELALAERYLELQRNGMAEEELRDWLKVVPESFIDEPDLPTLATLCQCGPEVTMGGYQNQAVVEIPAHMAEYRAAKLEAGLADSICIDRCILPEIEALWAKGIVTLGCCCGHHVAPPYVNTRPEDYDTMVALGYEPIDERRDTFHARSIKPEPTTDTP